MKLTSPEVFLIGETTILTDEIDRYLLRLGSSWCPDTDKPEELLEFFGRLCYRSFGVDLNPNITRIRKGNDKYLANIINSAHGSVLEHGSTNWVFSNVSRVFTHELVRHRAGTAISQESLRFVRLDNLGLWAPTVVQNDEEAMNKFVETFEHLEELQLWLAEHFEVDTGNFDTKKEITSAMRRLAPIGLSTTIGWTANFRALRHIIEARTDPHAEEELRLVFDQVARICVDRYPNVFQDFEVVDTINGIQVWKPEKSKI